MIARFFGRHFPRWFADRYVETRYGAKLVIEPAALDFYTTVLRWGGAWEHWVFDTLCWVMPEHGVLYDVGANTGYMTIETLQRLPGSRVVSFEPQPALAAALERSIAENGFGHRAHLHDCALGERHETLALAVPAHNIHASLVREFAASSRIEVDVVTLDALVARDALPPPDVVKLDVEGFETNVLRGAAATLRAARPHVLFEAGDRTACAAIVDLLDTLGSYRYVMATGSYRPLVDLDRARLPDAKVDVLAVSMARIESLPDAIRNHLRAGGLHGT